MRVTAVGVFIKAFINREWCTGIVTLRLGVSDNCEAAGMMITVRGRGRWGSKREGH